MPMMDSALSELEGEMEIALIDWENNDPLVMWTPPA